MTTTSGLGDWDLSNQDLYLNPNETDLLINALNSNKPAEATQTQSNDFRSSTNSDSYFDFDTSNAFDWDLRAMSKTEDTFTEYPPAVDKKSDGSEDGSNEGSPDYDDGEPGDKRKADSPEEDEGSGKRQETGKKTQKPGRKPLTSEPTTKRKAQNRAAQRAFRERKEKHLKDLEDKVDELQKKSDSADNENALLKAQVGRLQTELNEYRKRLSSSSLQSSFLVGKPLGKSSWDHNNDFNFEFPPFGNNNDKKSSTTSSPQNQKITSPISPNRSNSQDLLNNPDLKGLFSADVLSNADRVGSEHMSKHGSRSNSTIQPLSPSNTASPASSGFNGFTSSCVTTPEPTSEASEMRQSSDAGNRVTDKKSFVTDFQNSSTRSMSHDIPDLTPGAMTTTSTEASLDFGNFDWLAGQNGGEFNPSLFGDYREPQDNVMSGEGWFFNDALAVPDFGGSPLSQVSSHGVPKKTFMEEIEETQSGKEPEVVPGETATEFLTCNLLWDRVQNSAKVLSGEADMDDLCSQLKAKAKCSGSGAVIARSDVNEILGPAATKDVEPNYLNMFK